MPLHTNAAATTEHVVSYVSTDLENKNKKNAGVKDFIVRAARGNFRFRGNATFSMLSRNANSEKKCFETVLLNALKKVKTWYPANNERFSERNSGRILDRGK